MKWRVEAKWRDYELGANITKAFYFDNEEDASKRARACRACGMEVKVEKRKESK